MDRAQPGAIDSIVRNDELAQIMGQFSPGWIVSADNPTPAARRRVDIDERLTVALRRVQKRRRTERLPVLDRVCYRRPERFVAEDVVARDLVGISVVIPECQRINLEVDVVSTQTRDDGLMIARPCRVMSVIFGDGVDLFRRV